MRAMFIWWLKRVSEKLCRLLNSALKTTLGIEMYNTQQLLPLYALFKRQNSINTPFPKHKDTY